MDAVALAQSQFETILEGWAKEGQTLLRGAKALGIDASSVVAPLTTIAGTTPPSTPGNAVTGGTTFKSGGGTVHRRRTPARSRTRTKTTRSNNGRLTPEQMLGALREMGHASQAQLARHFGVSRETVRKRLEALRRTGQVERYGEGSAVAWQPKELIPA